MSRERLPNRRLNIGDSFLWGGRRVHVMAGLAHDGSIRECFLRGGGRVGSETDALLDDVAVLISHLLQRGAELADLAKGMGRLPPDGAASSIVGAAVDALLHLERGAA
jgi:hypothetical protein